MYNKYLGIIHTAGPEYRNTQQEETVYEEDDAQTKFYKQHMKRSEKPHVSGRTPIYNFDEWNEQHYGMAFKRNQEARKKFNAKQEITITEENSLKNEIMIFGILFCVVGVVFAFFQVDSATNDDPGKKSS